MSTHKEFGDQGTLTKGINSGLVIRKCKEIRGTSMGNNREKLYQNVKKKL